MRQNKCVFSYQISRNCCHIKTIYDPILYLLVLFQLIVGMFLQNRFLGVYLDELYVYSIELTYYAINSMIILCKIIFKFSFQLTFSFIYDIVITIGYLISVNAYFKFLRRKSCNKINEVNVSHIVHIFLHISTIV